MHTSTRWIVAIGILIIVGALAVMAYVAWWQPKDSTQDGSNKPDSSQAETPSQAGARTFTSVKGVTIELDNWPKDNVLTSPLTITGKVPGSWSFEGTFPIGVLYEGDIGLPGATATLQGDWMTTEMVPFTATLTFDEKIMASDDVAIILRNANPSGLPENDDSVSFPVRFAQ